MLHDSRAAVQGLSCRNHAPHTAGAQCAESAKCGKIARLSLEFSINVHAPVDDPHNADYFIKNGVENEVLTDNKAVHSLTKLRTLATEKGKLRETPELNVEIYNDL